LLPTTRTWRLCGLRDNGRWGEVKTVSSFSLIYDRVDIRFHVLRSIVEHLGRIALGDEVFLLSKDVKRNLVKPVGRKRGF
jgi:hypothetical protein